MKQNFKAMKIYVDWNSEIYEVHTMGTEVPLCKCEFNELKILVEKYAYKEVKVEGDGYKYWLKATGEDMEKLIDLICRAFSKLMINEYFW